MKYRSTERFPVLVSVIGLGCWGLSGPKVWKNSSDEQSIKVVHKALELGVNFFDVAPVYGFGHAEEILGKAIKGFPRDKIIIATKCGLVWDQQGRIKRCLTKESIMKEIDASLMRLKTDYVDLYQLHWPDPNTPIEETMEAMIILKDQGKVRFIGLSNFSIDTAARLLPHISSMQGLYNLFERNARSYHNIALEYRTESEVLPFCRMNGLAFFPYSPLMQGVLTGKLSQNEVFTDVRSANPKLVGENYRKYIDAVNKLKGIATKLQKPLSQISLNWLLRHEPVTSIIAGATSPEEVEENVKTVEWEMSDDVYNEIERIVHDMNVID
ncbi:MAG: aldo/keto reductase [Thermotoga caldifontis]|uniref:aldo/keto reductase n=1 Tax=Thermotoga caldifontis TaxID=1508419 RepID=UPI003C7DD6E5